MFKEVYDTREILLGLRNVYQESRQQLDELKKYVNISPKVGDCGFILYPCGPKDGDFVVLFKYTMAAENSGLLNVNQTFYSYATLSVDLYNNKVYSGCPYMSVSKHVDFINKLNEIYNGDFAKLITRSNMKSLDYNPALMYTTLNEINIFFNESANTFNSQLTYDSYSDQLTLTLFYDIAVNKDFINKALNDTLNTQFEKVVFSHYILENIQDIDTDIKIDICDYRTNGNGSKSYIFGIDNKRTLTKAKKLAF